MAWLNQADCCGIAELAGIRYASVADTMQACYTEWFNNGEYAFLFFSDITRKRQYESGRAMAGELHAYIKDHELGEVISPRANKNLNSNNNIKMYIWSVNRRNFNKWAKKQKWFAGWQKERDSYGYQW